MNSTHLAAVFVVTLAAVVAIIFTPSSHDLWTGASKGIVLSPGPPVEINESLREHRLFESAYLAKLENPEYQALKSKSGLPKEYQSFSEEAEVKEARSRLAKMLVAPTGVEPAVIPQLRGPPPSMDGRFTANEWQDALEVAIGVDGASTTLYLVADDAHLYLACDAANETTEGGYDQFRFYIHLDITPLLVNERIHVGRRSTRLGGIRQTLVRWRGAPPLSDAERWKSYDISDWQIYRHGRGASMIDGHRRYEAVLQLAEVGLHRGAPFPAWADVETDPQKKERWKQGGRRYLGRLGAQTAPVWFVME